MLDRVQAATAVREVIQSTWPGRFAPDALRENTSLGSEGLGLDSVELAELLLACEERYGRSLGDDLFDVVPLTIAGVAEHLAREG